MMANPIERVISCPFAMMKRLFFFSGSTPISSRCLWLIQVSSLPVSTMTFGTRTERILSCWFSI